MERIVPRTASDEIDLYLRTIYSLLRSTTDVQIRSLEEVHAGTHSLLHPDARKQSPDMSAFIYSLLRLPTCMLNVETVILGQSFQVFRQHGFNGVDQWQQAFARARRRRCFYDGAGTLACFIASRSDIDDIVPCLVAYQIEWNKIYYLMRRVPIGFEWDSIESDYQRLKDLAGILQITTDDLERLQSIWKKEFVPNLQLISQGARSISVRLLSGSMSDYRRVTNAWWENIENNSLLTQDRPVYFISSNTHSVVNLLSGFALKNQGELIEFLERQDDLELRSEWDDIRLRQVQSSRENFLYYILKKYQQLPEGRSLIEAQKQHELQCGIVRVPSDQYFDVEAQVIEIAQLKLEDLDPRLTQGDISYLNRSDALILNIDYPLGLAAYNILAKVAEHVHPILGVYTMGKAATLNSAIGDVMIPNVVHDEQSQNTYLYQNAFVASDIAPYLIYGTVLDNQKAVTVSGTYLQNAQYMDIFYREGYTVIEMEAGPYLSAVYEIYRPKRHPVNEIVNLYGIPFDLGILHYASDTPLGKGKNLGAGTLSYFGMDSTYATTMAILRRIIQLECRRMS